MPRWRNIAFAWSCNWVARRRHSFLFLFFFTTAKSHFFPAGRQRLRDSAKHARWGGREIRFHLFGALYSKLLPVLVPLGRVSQFTLDNGWKQNGIGWPPRPRPCENRLCATSTTSRSSSAQQIVSENSVNISNIFYWIRKRRFDPWPETRVLFGYDRIC